MLSVVRRPPKGQIVSHSATGAAHLTVPTSLAATTASYLRFLRAANLSPATIKTYAEAVRVFADFLADRQLPANIEAIQREHIEAFVTDQLERWRPATAANRYRGLQRFFGWLIEEGELEQNPMARVPPPRVPEDPPPVLSDDDLRRLLGTCERGRGLDHVRDHAILRILIDTGARRAEIAGLRYMPLRSLEDELLCATLPNTDDSGVVCLGSVRVTGANLGERVDALIAAFWGSRFNADIRRHPLPFSGGLRAWASRSRRDPLIALGFEYDPHPRNLRGVVAWIGGLAPDELPPTPMPAEVVTVDVHTPEPELDTNGGDPDALAA